MRAVIITEPPESMRYPRNQPPQFAGSYSNIGGVRRALEGNGHEVSVLVAFSNGKFALEEELYGFALLNGFNLGTFQQRLTVPATVGKMATNVLLFAVQRRGLPEVMPRILKSWKEGNRPQLIFASAGPAAERFLFEMASEYKVTIQRLNRPGVARITKSGLQLVIEAMRKPKA